jgi:hypothetical protein
MNGAIKTATTTNVEVITQLPAKRHNVEEASVARQSGRSPKSTI